MVRADTMAGLRGSNGGRMSFRKDNAAYEAWLAKQCKVVKKDIKYKHHLMKKSAFIFLRATYFRWAKQIGKLCPELMEAPQVLAVGDLHLENFGTWRDAEGRLIWGVNDFDEAAIMPYPLDALSARSDPPRGEYPARPRAHGQQSGGSRHAAEGIPGGPCPTSAGAA